MHLIILLALHNRINPQQKAKFNTSPKKLQSDSQRGSATDTCTGVVWGWHTLSSNVILSSSLCVSALALH